MNGHWCSQELEGGVSQVGDGLATEGEVGVVGPTGGGFDGNPNTLGDVGQAVRPGQPQLSEAEQMLPRGGPITDEGGVLCILQKVNPAGDRVEAVSQMGAQRWVIESTRVFITVLKMMTDNGSPW